MKSLSRRAIHGLRQGRTLFFKNLSLLILVAVTLSGISCSEEIILSGTESLWDARVQPRIIYTFPKMNTKGPYEGFHPYDGRFMIRFNKIMDRSSLIRALRVSSPFRDVAIRGISDVDGELFLFHPFDPRRDFGIVSVAKIHEVFTISFIDTVKDINGNIMLPQIIGTIEPEPFFRVASTVPGNGGLLDYQGIGIMFNSEIDTGIVRHILISPPLAGSWLQNRYERKGLTFQVTAPIVARTHQITVSTGAHDLDKNYLPESFQASFRIGGFDIVDSVILAPVHLFQPIGISFSSYLDFTTVPSAFHIHPQLACSLLPIQGSILLVPQEEYKPLTKYSITFDTTLKNAGGVFLGEPVRLTFTTPPFEIVATYPEDGGTGHFRRGDVNISFNSKLDTSSVRKAFEIVPPLSGRFFYDAHSIGFLRWPTFYFYPDDSLESFKKYSVVVDTSLRSIGGARLTVPYTFSFTTGGE